MADGAGTGILGVLVGAMLVIFVGFVLLNGIGAGSSRTSTFTIKLPSAN